MQISVKRDDKIEGYSDVPTRIEVRLYDEDCTPLERLKKIVRNTEVAVFEFESHVFDVECFIGASAFSVKHWELEESPEPIYLTWGLKKSNIEELDMGKVEIAQKEAKAKQDAEHQHMVSERLHPSQIVDEKMFWIWIAIAFFGLVIGGIGFLLISEHLPIGWLFALIGVAGLVAGGGMARGNPRCSKCNSDLIRLLKSDEVFDGVYSKQELVVNRNNNQAEYARVTKTDFRVTDYYGCALCKHEWTNRHTRTTTSD